jgi:Uma2 family endonuclease
VHFLELADAEHGLVTAQVMMSIGQFVEECRLGFVLDSGTGFLIEQDPDTVRAPDVAFVAAHRIKGRPTKKYLPFAPDLAVEVLSPRDSVSYVTAKAEQWLRAGASVVWLIDPQRSAASVAVIDEDELVIRDARELTAPTLLPGYSLNVASIFE